MSLPRAIGIVRVSQSNGRSGESFSSPQDQVDRMTALAETKGWQLTIPEPYEIDVSGDALLAARPQLSRAVIAIQTGEAEIIVGAHTERLWWNHETALQVIRLVEDANGEVWSADQGLLTRRSAADEFSGTVRTAADRLSRRQNREKSMAAIQRAISRGVPPWPRVTPGYRKLPDGRYEPDPRAAVHVSEAFEMRAIGATVEAVREYLQAHGVRLSYPGTVKLLKSKVVLGEIHFGTLFKPNLTAHPAIVDRGTWQTVQSARVPAGRKTKSERLLARLKILMCGTCGHLLLANVATAYGGGYFPVYRCQNADCTRRVSVSAVVAEQAVVDVTKRELSDMEGRASAAARAREAREARDRAQTELDSAIRVLAVVGDEPATVKRLEELRAARDDAQARVDELGEPDDVAVSVEDWDRLSFEERRGLVRSVVARAVVVPGRGAGRVVVEPFR